MMTPASTTPSGRFVDLAPGTALRVYVEEWGAGTAAPTVVCLHGLGGGTHYFSAFGASLAHRNRIVAIDLPGSGLSPLPPAATFTFDEAADLVVALAGREQWTRVCLVGHSMGTIVALEVIRRAPDLAAALIAVGGLPEPLPGARQRLSTRIDEIRRDGIAGHGTRVVAVNVARRTQRERPDLTGLLAKLFDQQSADAYTATAQALAQWQARPLPPLDDVRCLAVTGDEDLYAPPEAVRDFARELPAGTRVVTLPDCGHLPFLEQPGAFSDTVGSFLDEIGW
jgi:pimeloyl-ACP methyl ester carboxylesterase